MDPRRLETAEAANLDAWNGSECFTIAKRLGRRNRKAKRSPPIGANGVMGIIEDIDSNILVSK